MSVVGDAVAAADTSAPVVTDAPAVEAPGQDPTQAQSWIERIKAKYGADPTAAAEAADASPASTDPEVIAQPDAVATPAEAPAEPVTPVVEPPVEKPKQSRLELDHARTLSENQRITSELVELKKAHGTSQAELVNWQKAFEKNPFKALEKWMGKPLPELIEAGKRGDFDKQELELPAEVQATVQWAKDEQVRQAQYAKQAQRQADFAADLPKAQRFVEQFAKDYPLIASIEDGAQSVLEEYYDLLDAGKKPDMRAVAKDLEGRAAQHFMPGLKNAKLIKHAVQDPEVRKILIEALGLAQQQPASPASSTQGVLNPTPKTPATAPPNSVATQTEVPERSDRQPTEAELAAERLKLFRQGKESGRFSP